MMRDSTFVAHVHNQNIASHDNHEKLNLMYEFPLLSYMGMVLCLAARLRAVSLLLENP